MPKRYVLSCIAVFAMAAVLLATAANADRVFKQTVKGKAHLTVQADELHRADGNERSVHELYLCLARGRIQKWTAPEGWDAVVNGREIWWYTAENPVVFGTSMSEFSVKVSGRGRGSWITRDESGDYIAWDFISLKH